MIRLTKDAFSDALAAIDPQSCGAVYPLSAASGIQCGDIFAAKDAFVIRHSCGFAFLAGTPDQHVLSEVYAQFLAPDAACSERFLLFLQDGPALRYFQAQRGLTIERRLFFAYRHAKAPEAVPLPEGFSCCEITMPLLMQMQGKVTPFFSWTHPDAFLRDGRGFCIVRNEKPVSWAFSAAVSADETDIGVETDSAFRHMGLARAAAAEMIRDCIRQNRQPVWACHAANTASRMLAEKLGFTQISECCTVRRSDS